MMLENQKKKAKNLDKYATQESPVIFQPLSEAPILVSNLHEKDELKTATVPAYKPR